MIASVGRPARLLRSLTVAMAVSLAAGSVLAQPAGGADEPPPVTTEDVRSALQEIVASADAAEEAVTTDDPEVDPVVLDRLLEPLTLSQLKTEMSAWQDLLQGAVNDLSEAEIELLRLNAEQEKAQGEEAADAPAESEPELTPEQEELVKKISGLRERRTAISDRFRLVMDAYEDKGGDPADTQSYRAYVKDVGGVQLDTRDLNSAWLTLKEWAYAEDGGKRLARKVMTVLIATVVGIMVGWLLSLAVSTTLRKTGLSSQLMRHFLRRWIARLGGLIGFLVGLSWIGTNMTPILAGLGAAGFILAFALQNTISNFASGMLILFLRPFDAGDEIEAAGVSGEVEKVSLFSTHLSTAENRKVIVPNNKIWEDVIVNSTGADTRRLSLEIEVKASEHSLDEAESILRKVMEENPDVMKEPAPALTLSAMTGDAYTFTCWPWVQTAERNRVRWQLVSEIGRRLSVVKGATKPAEESS
ncbi:mechanosensitive ion channel [Paracoccus sp. MBLB3053]|uniref:Small-conductance mechanosensitive channel n=1 Tax=Paracoccus aurantius TaxID=3073814 RepID=A0ABU2HW35_9RHOB|nr:mechanosensitive ion channel domain-containing protein [Paracoccus sp. MBLB3053]MDS9469261.1 mechanosensitive ion channel [Paracoccus sp. MBLB3053]